MLWLKSRGEGRAAPGTDGVLGRSRLDSRPSGSRPAERAGEAPASLLAPRSVAVLPFVNVTGQPAVDTLAFAVARRIYERLNRLERVIAVAYSGPLSASSDDVYLAHVGQLLRVEALLLGQVRRSAGGLRATAELLDAASGAHLWAGCFRDARRHPDLGARIADDVAQHLWANRPVRP